MRPMYQIQTHLGTMMTNKIDEVIRVISCQENKENDVLIMNGNGIYIRTIPISVFVSDNMAAKIGEFGAKNRRNTA